MKHKKPPSPNVQNLRAISGQIQEARRTLDYGAYGRLIQHFTDHRLPRQAQQLHARLVVHSVTPDNFLASKLINFYSKCRKLFQARSVFDKIPLKSIFSYNTMLIAYSGHDMYTDALKLFSSLLSSYSMNLMPDNFTITCVLKALTGLFREPKLAKEVHSYVFRCGLDSSLFLFNGLITFYSRCDDIASARTLFDTMPERDIVSWNSMIAGYSQAGFYEECKALYRKMLNSSVLRPDGVTAVSVLQACGQSNDIVFGMEVHKSVIESQIKMDLCLCNALIGMYAKCGSLDYARALFEEMSDKDEVSCSAIISGYMVHGFVDEALDLFQEMKPLGLNTWNAVISGLVQNNRHEGVLDLVRQMQAFGLRPNAVTVSSTFSMFSYFSNLKGAKEMHGYAVKNGYAHNIYVATAIVDTYAKTGFLHGAQQVFDQFEGRSLIIWTAIISAYASHGDAGVALNLFSEMLDNGIQPDPVTFTAVLSACAHSGLVDNAWNIFYAMSAEYGIRPSVEHYACLVGVLSRARRLSEAVEFVSKMPIEPSEKVWGALLYGASISGDVELGKFVCDRLFEIEPENTGNYIIMANLYSQAGRWEEADRVREKMKEIGLKKIPGRSWIESSGGLQSFIAKDASSDRTEEIYMILEGLLGLMRQEGYILQDEFDEEIAYV